MYVKFSMFIVIYGWQCRYKGHVNIDFIKIKHKRSQGLSKIQLE